MPRVSVGLPVFNAAEYLHSAFQLLLGQSYENFEVIVSDNASTDGTGEICSRYAAIDARIVYSRNNCNMGIAWNHNLVFQRSSGDFFMWASHDDVTDAHYIERCVAALEGNPSAVVAVPKVGFIDEEGQSLTRQEPALRTDSHKPHVRFSELIRMDHTCEGMYGVMRAAVLRRTGLHGLFPDSDRVLLAELSLHGSFVKVPDSMFLRRMYTRQICPGRHERVPLFDPASAGKMAFPYFREYREYLSAINRAPLTARERGRCYMLMQRWLWTNRKCLKDDVLAGLHRTAKNVLSLFRTPSSDPM